MKKEHKEGWKQEEKEGGLCRRRRKSRERRHHEVPPLSVSAAPLAPGASTPPHPTGARGGGAHPKHLGVPGRVFFEGGIWILQDSKAEP